ncbi:hypothetical protein BVIET440_220067 [Burkholderia vietnamiensis]
MTRTARTRRLYVREPCRRETDSDDTAPNPGPRDAPSGLPAATPRYGVAMIAQRKPNNDKGFKDFHRYFAE